MAAFGRLSVLCSHFDWAGVFYLNPASGSKALLFPFSFSSDLPLFCCRSYSSTSIEEAMKRGEDPPTPPPRPQKTHSRASSLDLNKVFQPSVPGEVLLCTLSLFLSCWSQQIYLPQRSLWVCRRSRFGSFSSQGLHAAVVFLFRKAVLARYIAHGWSFG